MRKSCLLIFVIVIQIVFWAKIASTKVVDKGMVEQVAQNFLTYTFLKQRDVISGSNSYAIEKIEKLEDPKTQRLLAYLINIKPKGFLIISPDTALESIIAYSFHCDWDNTISNNNVIYALLALNINSKIKGLQKSHEHNFNKYNTRCDGELQSGVIENFIFQQWPEEGSTATDGWVETTWHQCEPYNKYCPIDPVENARSSAGCAAIAMAQIVNYHAYLGVLEFGHGDEYVTVSSGIQVDLDSSKCDFPSFHQLNSFIEQVKYKYGQNEELTWEEEAALCFACGVTLKIDYTAKASCSYRIQDIAHSLKNKLKYYGVDDFIANRDFYKILIENLINGLPAILIVEKHAIIADGYNTDGFFHLNFGWGCEKPAVINEAWWKIPEYLPDNYDGIESGFLNINPFPFEVKPQIAVSDSIVFLPGALVNEGSEIKHITLFNPGETPVTIDHVIASHNFFVIAPEFVFDEPTVLQPGGELDLYITCIPDTLGRIEGKIQIFASYLGQYKYHEIELIGLGVPGTLVNKENISGRWEKRRSPYYICKDIFVATGQKLIIEPGVEIVFNGPYQISIEDNAQLVARGEESDSIYFRAADTLDGWRGLHFIDSAGDDSLIYCVVQNINYTSSNELTSLLRGAISIVSSSPVITHSTIRDNRSFGNGGALFLYRSSAKILNNLFKDNVCDKCGGAMYLYQSFPYISNNVICQNEATYGGAIYASQSSLALVNVTIAYNKAFTIGGAITLGGKNNFAVKNSIIWGNEAGLGSTFVIGNCDTISISYSDIDTTAENWLYGGAVCDDLELLRYNEGNICIDPLFTSQNNAYLTLQPHSLCIDAGHPDALANDTCLPPGLGTWRNDMGAYGGANNCGWNGLTTSKCIDVSKNSLINSILVYNYPNPFNSITNIIFTLPYPARVHIAVYNPLGQKVEDLSDSIMPAGYHEMEFRAYNLASGIYLCRIEVMDNSPGGNGNRHQIMHKMILLK